MPPSPLPGSSPKLPDLPIGGPFCLNAICDVDVCARARWAPRDLALAYLKGGVRFLQVRAKQMPSGEFLSLCDEVVRAARPFGALVIVNDRVDVARLSGASGVHVGQEDLSPASARDQLGDTAIIGVSNHNEPQIREALKTPLSYLAVGPIFGTSTKDTGYEAVGLELVSLARGLAPPHVPVVAIGGITLANAASVIQAGAQSVAVISDLLADGDPAARVGQFLRALA